MRYSYRRGLLWLAIYFLFSLIPLAVVSSGHIPEYRAFWIEFAVALGYIGLAMLALQFLFTGRLQKIAPSYGMDNLLHFHKEMGIVAFLFVLAHPIILIAVNPGFLAYFDPSINLLRAVFLSFASVALIFIMASSLWRATFNLSYETWRLIHGLLALAIVFIGLSHALQVGHYLNTFGKQAVVSVLIGGCMYAVIHTRLVRPWLNRKKPYRVVGVKEERGDAWSIEVEAVGHKKMQYQCGQFAWLTIHDSPFSIQQHPFSMTSSTESDTLSFTAKVMGDFTSTWKDIKIGDRLFLEGPFGSFTPIAGKNLFLIMGGIGITPGISMLRTMRDKKDKRKVTLIYGNENLEEATFYEELEELNKELNLQLLHLLTDPPKGWEGETGKIDREFLEKYLPEDSENYIYLICGPDPLMDIAEIALKDLGVDWRCIYTERFKIV